MQPATICTVQAIYQPEYLYSLPQKILESFLSGKAFDNPTEYSQEEASRLQDDINEIWNTIIATNPDHKKVAIITAGAPGAGKTIKLEQIIAEERAVGNNYGYIDPDAVCLKQQARTYQVDIAAAGDSKEARVAAYTKWRPGSNAANHLALATLIREQFALCFGTTSSGPATGKFFEFLKKQGYSIRLIHVTASDAVRWASVQERDKTFVQTTEADTAEKGLLLPQRISDTYLAFADSIEFYYRAAVEEDAKLAATWTNGELEIANGSRYEKIKAIHNATVDLLHRPELKWEATVEAAKK